jgi:3',5'-cyclic-AMP phosphodiesterase
MLIAQITDLHLVEKNTHWLMEPLTETNKRLSRVIAHLNQLDPRPDIVLITGDATDEGDAPAYTHLTELLAKLEIPFFIIPGNHDKREGMRNAFPTLPRKGFLHYIVDTFPIRLIALDTLVEGHSHGELCEERFLWLKEALKTDKPTLIFMHHPPAKTGTKLFDQILCKTPFSFESLLKESPHLMGILSGHYHHLCVTTFATKLCFMAPSVAPVHYFAHPEDGHVTALELEDPAITLHRCKENEPMISHIVRVKDKHRIDWKSIVENQTRRSPPST